MVLYSIVMKAIKFYIFFKYIKIMPFFKKKMLTRNFYILINILLKIINELKALKLVNGSNI